MHQAYFERKMSQPSTSTTSRSITPKPFSRMQEDPSKSPDRINSEYSQLSNHSPTVSSQKNLSTTNTPFGSSSKAAMKAKEQVLHTDRLRNRSQQGYYYNPKNPPTMSNDLLRMKATRNNVITKTEPSTEMDISYTGQINKLLQKINKLKQDLSQSQEKEALYLSKLSNLESENRSLQMIIEEKEKRIQDITQKSKEDKLRMYQFLTELETYKQNNPEQHSRDDVSTVKLSDLCDSTKKSEKGALLEKGIQATEGSSSTPCTKCESVTSYCELLMNKLNEVEQASKYILKENNAMKESLMKARKAESDYVRARSEIEKRAVEIQSDFDKQALVYNEIIAENLAVRKTLKETLENDSVTLQGYPELKKSVQLKAKKENSQKMFPVPAALKALVGAEKLLKAVN